MAPSEARVEWQTSEIIRYLLEDEEDVKCRQAVLGSTSVDACLEHDGPEDDFDPVVIADKLRQVADAFNDDVMFKNALADMKKAAAQEAVDAAFSHGVEALCQTQVPQSAEVTPEMQLIQASVAFGLYAIKSSPELKTRVHDAMNSFLNNRVRSWVTKQGGWEKVQLPK